MSYPVQAAEMLTPTFTTFPFRLPSRVLVMGEQANGGRAYYGSYGTFFAQYDANFIPLKIFTGHYNGVTGIAISLDGQYVVSGITTGAQNLILYNLMESVVNISNAGGYCFFEEHILCNSF